MELSKKEKQLIKHIRGTEYGQITIKVENNQPHRVIRVEESILLTTTVEEIIDRKTAIGIMRIDK